MKVRLTLTEHMLGTKAADAKIFETFLNSLHKEDESEAAVRAEGAGMTIFHRSKEGQVGIWNYQIKGFFKDAAQALNRADEDQREGLEKLTAHAKNIDQCIFVEPRFILIEMPKGGSVGTLERPLRGQTAQGERIALVKSETVPADSVMDIDLKIMSSKLKPYVKAWLNYGSLRGLGQWRNSGCGCFSWEEM